MPPEWIWDALKTGGPAVTAILCFWLYLRESTKRDEAYNKLEKITERVLEALHNVDTVLTSNATSTESMKSAINTVIAFLSVQMHKKPDDE